ncbi:hypothetical protein T09_556, partial [Trichinella sp. T9]
LLFHCFPLRKMFSYQEQCFVATGILDSDEQSLLIRASVAQLTRTMPIKVKCHNQPFHSTVYHSHSIADLYRGTQIGPSDESCFGEHVRALEDLVYV